jgi:hypothetical protein
VHARPKAMYTCSRHRARYRKILTDGQLYVCLWNRAGAHCDTIQRHVQTPAKSEALVQQKPAAVAIDGLNFQESIVHFQVLH